MFNQLVRKYHVAFGISPSMHHLDAAYVEHSVFDGHSCKNMTIVGVKCIMTLISIMVKVLQLLRSQSVSNL